MRTNEMGGTSGSEKSNPLSGGTKVECLPIQWHHGLEEKKRRLATASLPSVSKVRDFNNEVVTDALFFLTPRWRNVMLDTAAARIRQVVESFKADNPSWDPFSLSVVGHSLGTAILFELLTGEHLPESQQLNDVIPRNFIALGSPIAYIVDAQEDEQDWLNQRLSRIRIQKKGNFRNLFHPNDPIAYRLEPLLMPCSHNETTVTASGEAVILPPVPVASLDQPPPPPPPPPSLLATPTKEQEKKKVPTSPPSKTSDETTSSMAEVVTTPRTPFCQACFDSHLPQLTATSSSSSEDDGACDALWRRRIDFALQIEMKSKLSRFLTEYWSALGAHTCYFSERDVTKFILDTIAIDSMECPEELAGNAIIEPNATVSQVVAETKNGGGEEEAGMKGVLHNVSMDLFGGKKKSREADLDGRDSHSLVAANEDVQTTPALNHAGKGSLVENQPGETLDNKVAVDGDLTGGGIDLISSLSTAMPRVEDSESSINGSEDNISKDSPAESDALELRVGLDDDGGVATTCNVEEIGTQGNQVVLRPDGAASEDSKVVVDLGEDLGVTVQAPTDGSGYVAPSAVEVLDWADASPVCEAATKE
jgi:hypothetical protein